MASEFSDGRQTQSLLSTQSLTRTGQSSDQMQHHGYRSPAALVVHPPWIPKHQQQGRLEKYASQHHIYFWWWRWKVGRPRGALRFVSMRNHLTHPLEELG